jgi:hypothetical protein
MGTRKHPPSKAPAKNLAGRDYVRKGSTIHEMCGEERIRTSDRGFSLYNGLANRRLRPLGHLSINRGRKFQIMITKEPYRIKGVTTAKAKERKSQDRIT